MTCAVPAAGACLVAALVPALHPLGEVVAALAGLVAAVVLWGPGRPADRSSRPWRLLAAAALFPVTGLLVSVLAAPSSPLEEVVLRWVVIVPGYVLAVVGLLGMVERAALRRTCPRAALELALFGTAALVVMQALLVGPGNSWSALAPVARLVLGGAVVATAATMAAGLTVLGGVAGHRQRMAVVLLAGLVALCVGRGTGTSAALLGAPDAVPVTRVAVVVGLALLVLARLLDGAPSPGPAAASRAVQLRAVLPHLALVVVVGIVVVPLALGLAPSAVTLLGALLCVGLSAAHRWVAAREDHLRGARLRRDEAYFRSLVASTSEAVLVLDARLRVGWASPALAALLGSTPAELVGHDLLSGRSAVDAGDATALRLRLEAGETSGLLTLHVRDGAGGVRCLEASVSDLRADPALASVVLHCRDVTEREARERALEEVAFTDPLTGLPNRAGWEAALTDAVARAGAVPDRALLLVDVCGLTEVREHADRDTVSGVLVELGRRLRATVRGEDVVARVAGGVFGVLATGDGDTADRLADRCLAALERPVGTPAGVFDLTADVGVVVVEPGLTVAELTARAETTVAAARAGGSARATRWTDALGAAAARRDRLREDLPGAVDRGELWLAFQPIVSMDEQRVVGVEALLRWRHPELGDVPPREFVPIAERAGVIGELQRWVLREATVVAAALPEHDGRPLQLGVNTSASHVAARTLVDDVAAALASSGLAPERLVLEVTEATLLDDGDFVATDVQALRLMGVHVALDDFGTGTSSLLHLTRLPIDVLKLDRAFVSRVDRDAQSRALCAAVVTVGRALGVDVVAEGVETSAQLGVLRGLGLGFAQGFLLSRPLPPAELLDVLREGAGSLWPGLVGLSQDPFPAAGDPHVQAVRGA
ncbi:PAS domain S-box-containing protein/diguanylate cyclase (GGDEF) domain-containing protein [Geodermatophilus telluris]|uniref:PAS domain S-box-containing protein/diguanylate cyclase (GGDEF) domain-containing protein n=1 Tax=Geodermatophilus telluris TaxID=1190417 RepID=A0A1G6I104_9ACTN|nr:GGDEF domain-containing phosphodiesterase [Geodermatophilus telluris]SDC00212.1 PAS domain S-box-containing protein/diguanylate cyclase (GGDEF) domain-containing protein [Geodermatophilus telluris]